MTIKEKNRLGLVDERVGELEHKVDEVLFILKSNQDYNKKGLVEKVDSISKILSELLKRELVYKSKGTVWGIVGGSLVMTLGFIGKFLITKFFL
jgi:hypothetical protein